MTALRRYVFGFLAVCTALAVGIALGTGPLRSDLVGAADTAQTSRVASSADARNSSRLSAAVTAGTADRLLHNTLSGRTVTVVVLPGAAHRTVTAMAAAVERAGALQPLVVHLMPGVVDPGKKTYVDSVARSALKHRPDVARTAGHDTYQRMGAVLARAYVGSGSRTAYDSESRDIDAELQGAKMVTLSQPPVRRGSFVVVVAPRPDGQGQYAAASQVIEAQLVTALAARSDGALLLSPPAVGNGHGDVGGEASLVAGWPLADRHTERLSTLNAVAGPASRVTAIYALLSASDGKPGDFGVFGRRVRLPAALTGSHH